MAEASYEELHEFVAHLRIPHRGFDLDHYDALASRDADAIKLGAGAMSAKDLVNRLQGYWLRARQVDKQTMKPVRRREYLVSELEKSGWRPGLGKAPR